MKISAKLISVRFLFLFIMLLGTFLASYFYAIPHVEQHEKSQGLKDISRVIHRTDQELDLLRFLATGWGEWDDTYAYINDRNKAYEKSNLGHKTLLEMEIDFIFIVKVNGQVIWKQFSEKIKKFATPALWQKNNWGEQHPFIALMSDQEKGLIYSDFGALLVAGSQIVTSQGKGDSRGYFFFGKLISNELVKKFSQDLEFQIEMSIAENQDADDVHFVSQHKKIVYGKIKLANSSTHSLSISIFQSRPFYQEAIKAIKYNLLVVLGLGVLSSVITFFILKKILINPIIQLRQQAFKFGRDQSSIPIKLLNSNDELGHLSASLVNMANELKRIWGLQEQEKNEYLTASNTDALTQLNNRRCMISILSKQQTWSTPKHWSFLMLDIDYFKNINDKWGHDVGDTVLQQFSSILKEVCRGSDIIFRSGGEEFVVVCEGATQVQGCLVVERIRKAVEIYEFGPGGKSFNVTCSIGFYSMYNTKPNVNWEIKLKLADCAMYAAKNSGRNTWVGLAINQQSPLLDKYKLPGDVDSLVADIKSEKLLVLSPQPVPEDVQWR
ncbi:MAG: diguanylate cyclase [Pseudomonadales bacterium]|nr:diguanylate cyclase [Pseudomonadales bacterium]NRA18240.1 diguanylate cyclase [Oceanospirillaceae bacterium]